MNILMFGWELPPHNSGGLGIACMHLASALTAANNNITFVLPRKIEVKPSNFNVVFADTRPLSPSLALQAYSSSLHEKVRDKRAGGHTSLLNEVYAYASRVRELIKELDFDIIHAHDWLSFPAAWTAKELSNKPLICHVHATEFDRTGGTGVNQEVYDIEKHGMDMADRVITVSNFTKGIVRERYGIDEQKVHVVHNGIDKQSQVSLKGDILKLKEKGQSIVLFVGRLTLQKGPDYFVRMAKHVVQYRPNTVFVMVGSGDMEGQIIREAVELGIGDKVLFAGFLRDSELAAMYQSADVFVMPSVSEPFGITALEAAAHGIPVLLSKQSGANEVLAHTLKADFWDVEEMTNKIVTLLNHATLGQTLKQHSQQEISSLTWQKAAEHCMQVYQSILAPTRILTLSSGIPLE